MITCHYLFHCVQYRVIILIFSRWVLESIMKNNNKTVDETKEVVQSFLRYTIYDKKENLVKTVII